MDAERPLDLAGAEDAHDDLLSQRPGHGAHPELHFPAVDRGAELAVLGKSPLGDNEIGHDLDPGRQTETRAPRKRAEVLERAVDAHADVDLLLLRLDMDIAGIHLDRAHRGRDPPDQGRVVGHGFQAGRGPPPAASPPSRCR